MASYFRFMSINPELHEFMLLARIAFEESVLQNRHRLADTLHDVYQLACQSVQLETHAANPDVLAAVAQKIAAIKDCLDSVEKPSARVRQLREKADNIALQPAGTAEKRDVFIPHCFAGLSRSLKQKHWILICNFHDAEAQAIASIMRLAGHEAIICGDCVKTMEVLEKARVDAVIAHLSNGISTLNKIRGNRHLRDLPVIIAADSQDIDRLAMCAKAKASALVAKPFNPLLLRSIVEMEIQKYHAGLQYRRENDGLKLLAQVVRGLPDMVTISDENGQTVYANDSVRQLTGKSVADSTTCRDLDVCDSDKQTCAQCMNAISGMYKVSVKDRLGKDTPALVHVFPLSLFGENPTHTARVISMYPDMYPDNYPDSAENNILAPMAEPQ